MKNGERSKYYFVKVITNSIQPQHKMTFNSMPFFMNWHADFKKVIYRRSFRKRDGKKLCGKKKQMKYRAKVTRRNAQWKNSFSHFSRYREMMANRCLWHFCRISEDLKNDSDTQKNGSDIVLNSQDLNLYQPINQVWKFAYSVFWSK